MAYFKDSCGVGFIASIKGEKSYEIIDKGLKAVSNLTHRGAALSDGRTGDGSGILFQIPHEFFVKEARRIRGDFNCDKVTVGTFFLKGDVDGALSLIEERVKAVLGDAVLREVPVDASECGEIARQRLPEIYQVIAPNGNPVDIYVLGKVLEKELQKINGENYVASFSNRVTVYKGMLLAPDLKKFFLDLRNEELKSSFVIFHH